VKVEFFNGIRRSVDLRRRGIAALGTNGRFRKVRRSMQSVTPTAGMGRERQKRASWLVECRCNAQDRTEPKLKVFYVAANVGFAFFG